MRSVLLLILVLALSAGVASAQVNPAAGRIGIFGDATASSCVFTTSETSTFNVYVVHVENSLGIGGVEFWAPKPDCLNAEWLADINIFGFVLGNTQTGYTTGYGICATGTTHVCTMRFLGNGPTSECCVYYVYDHPAQPSPYYEFSDCNLNLVYGGAKAGMANPNSSCTCESIPVQDTSWGAIKALYSD
jgi:hypothetical protein